MSSHGSMNTAGTAGAERRRRWTSLDFMLVVFALALTAVSGWTTYNGMKMIVVGGNDAASAGALFGVTLPSVQHLVALVFTICVQVALTAFSWILGKDLARALSQRRHDTGMNRAIHTSIFRAGTMIAILAGCFLVSTVFSYSDYFNRLYSGETVSLRAADEAPRVLREVKSLLERDLKDHRAASIASVEADGERKAWFDVLGKVGTQARQSQSKLDDLVKRQTQERIEREKAALDAQLEAARQAGSKDEVITLNQQRIAAIPAEIKAKEDQITSVQAEIIKLRDEAERLGEQAREESNRGPGGGPCPVPFNCRGSRTRALETQQQEKNTEADTKVRGQEKLRADIKKLRDEALVAETAIKKATLEKQQLEQGASPSENPVQKPATVSQDITDVSSAIEALQALQTGFAALPSLANYKQLEATCGVLLKAIQTASPDDESFKSASCANPAVVRLAEEFDRAEAARASYGDVCKEPEGEALTFDNTPKLLQTCLDAAAGTGASIGDAESRVAAFKELRDPSRHPLERIRTSFDAAPTLAAIAAFLALFQDLMVFLLTFAADTVRLEHEHSMMVEDTETDYSVQDTDAPRVAAAKLISTMALPAPGRPGRSLYDVGSAAHDELRRDHRENVTSLLNSLSRQRLANFVEQDDGRSVFEIDQSGMQRLEEMIKTAKPVQPVQPTVPPPATDEPERDAAQPAQRRQAARPGNVKRRFAGGGTATARPAAGLGNGTQSGESDAPARGIRAARAGAAGGSKFARRAAALERDRTAPSGAGSDVSDDKLQGAEPAKEPEQPSAGDEPGWPTRSTQDMDEKSGDHPPVRRSIRQRADDGPTGSADNEHPPADRHRAVSDETQDDGAGATSHGDQGGSSYADEIKRRLRKT